MRGICVAALLIACGSDAPPTVTLPSVDACAALRDGTWCSEGVALRCASGREVTRTDCASMELQCIEQSGCRVCAPYAVSCDGDLRSRCSADGSRSELVEQCPPELSCSPAGCRDLCADAVEARAYLGCEYWPVFTANRLLPLSFQPAVSIGNGNLVSAHVTVTRGGQPVTEMDIAPRSSGTIMLAYDQVLQRATGSVLQPGGAYRLRSSVPVTVHQFNPLLFELPMACPGIEDPPKDAVCLSHTNDASLLLPTTALGPDSSRAANEVTYLVVSRASFIPSVGESQLGGGGFAAIVAGGTQPVNVQVTVTAHTSASSMGEDIAALAPGDVLTRKLAPGDVLQLLSRVPGDCPGTLGRVGARQVCDPGRDYDLTGTEVRADGPIQVIGGHDCTYVPFDRPACDHLEESLPPLHAWGRAVLVTRPRVSSRSSFLLRVLSGSDRNLIVFDPPVHPPVTLDRGNFVELSVDQAVYVTGSGRLLAAQYLIGQGAFLNVGDPSLSIAPPVDQYRSTYDFVTPATYSINYADVVTGTGDVVVLDGKRIEGFTPVGASGLAVATVTLERPGAHVITGGASRGIGLLLYGFGSYTSYMLPGGLDLTPLPDVGI